jgi:hypothetical protein
MPAIVTSPKARLSMLVSIVLATSTSTVNACDGFHEKDAERMCGMATEGRVIDCVKPWSYKTTIYICIYAACNNLSRSLARSLCFTESP